MIADASGGRALYWERENALIVAGPRLHDQMLTALRRG